MKSCVVVVSVGFIKGIGPQLCGLVVSVVLGASSCVMTIIAVCVVFGAAPRSVAWSSPIGRFNISLAAL